MTEYRIALIDVETSEPFEVCITWSIASTISQLRKWLIRADIRGNTVIEISIAKDAGVEVKEVKDD